LRKGRGQIFHTRPGGRAKDAAAAAVDRDIRDVAAG